MMKLYTLTAYLDAVKVGSGTVLEDHPTYHLVSQANEWFGDHNWNRLEIAYYKEVA
jgi:riboflavin biosynthesis pyrimidine reductase